jgi:hypothetical protein
VIILGMINALYKLSNIAVIGRHSSLINFSQSQVAALFSRPGVQSLFNKVGLNHGYLRRDIRKHDLAIIPLFKRRRPLSSSGQSEWRN